MILQTLPWKLQTGQDSLLLLLPLSFPLLFAVAAAYSAPVSASFPKEQNHFIFRSQFLISPHFVTEQNSQTVIEDTIYFASQSAQTLSLAPQSHARPQGWRPATALNTCSTFPPPDLG